MSNVYNKINSFLFGDTEEIVFENKIFNIITLISALTLLLAFINNLFNNFPTILNIVLAVFCLIFSLFFYLSSFRRITRPLLIPFYIIVLFLLSFTWFFNQGIEGSVPFYFFLVMFILIYINSQKRYGLVLFLFIVLGGLLVAAAYIFPELETPYPNKQDQLLDLTTNFFIIIFLLGISTIFLKKSFDKERAKVELYAEEMKDLNATKDKLFSIISHDLKNSFNSTLGISRMLLSDLDKYSTKEIYDNIMLISESSNRAYNLLENLLEWSMAQTGKIQFNPEAIKLTEVAEESIVEITNQANNKNIKIVNEIKNEHRVIADKNMLKIVLRNLLSNAVKYSYDNSNVCIRSEEQDKEIIISVIDHGVGIARENIEHLFRIDSKYSTPGTKNEHGTGLGLILCKEFIEKQGGKVWVKCSENNGCTFNFTLSRG
jgi:two-component system, sensor histidine kinase and response regulator